MPSWQINVWAKLCGKHGQDMHVGQGSCGSYKVCRENSPGYTELPPEESSTLLENLEEIQHGKNKVELRILIDKLLNIDI